MAKLSRCCALLVVLVTTALLSVQAALPFYDWTYGSSNPQQTTANNAFTSFPGLGMTVSSGINATGAAVVVGIATSSGTVVWQVASPCNTINYVIAHPSRDSPEAAAVIVCGTQYVALIPGNGTTLWTVPVRGFNIAPQVASANPLPYTLHPFAGHHTDYFIAPLYYQDSSNNVLAVMAIIDPVRQRVRSVEVLCFQTTTNLQLIPETQMVLLTCVPPPNAAHPGPSSVRAFTLEAGTLVEQWSFYSAQGETFVTSVAPTMVFVAAATGTVQQPAAYYVSIDLQGNATLLAPVGNVPAFYPGQTYSAACTPSGLVGLVTPALATVAQVNVAAATLTFVTSYAPASSSNFFAVTAFVSGGASYLMPYESDYVYYHVLNGTSGAQLLLVPTSAYANPNIAAIKISHDTTAKLVMISGLGGIVGISFAQPAAPSVVFITTVQDHGCRASAGSSAHRATRRLPNRFLERTRPHVACVYWQLAGQRERWWRHLRHPNHRDVRV
jgi:hypothetical protein